MNFHVNLAVLLLGVFSRYVAGKAVFCHYMVDNTGNFTETDWKTDMILAGTVGIDAFALNIASGNSINDEQIANAFAAAEAYGGIQLFFSFDYAGNGAWDKSDVISLIQQYGSNSVYYQRDGAPFVSTFEGPGSAADWVDIKSETGCFFIPDWSSLGAKAALELQDGIADGLFSWAAWSWGGDAMDTYTDASYIQYLDGKPYMMPAAGWFYTNLPGYDKNWMWPVLTMNLWEQRWVEILFLQPDYVEIISWNDFGESHYIGNAESSPPFEDGDDTYDYVTGVKHEAWLRQLSAWTQLYKTGTASFTNEMLTATYLKNHVEDCSDGDTTVNTASQLQYEYSPSDIFEGSYYISYTALLASEASVTVTVGGTSMAGSWVQTPVNNVGFYHGYTYIGTKTGDVTITLNRDGSTIATIDGDSIGGCTDGYTNFNPVALMAFADGTVSATTSPSIDDQVCIQGTGASGFAGICGITCEYGYCPVGACVCTQLGKQKTLPDATGLAGYAKNDTNYIGLCSWGYTYGFADSSAFTPYCTDTDGTLSTPSVSPFLPPACTAGEVSDSSLGSGINALCSFACNYGWCPIHLCTCTDTGALVDLPSVSDSSSSSEAAAQYDDNVYISDTCAFACEYGYCPLDICYTPDLTELGSTDEWMSINCSHGTLTSDLNPGYERWADADAEDAWTELKNYFENYKSTASIVTDDSHTTYNNFEFSQIIADHIHATSNRQCEFVPNTECDTTVSCDDQFSGATGVSSPAGYMIINSIANIHSMLDEMWNAVDDAVQDYNGKTDEVVTAFEDIADTEKIKLTLDAVGLVYGLIAAPFWNSWLKSVLGDDFKNIANTAGTLKDSMSAIMSNSLSFIKDSLSSTQGISDAIAFQELATNIGDGMKSTITDNAHSLFNGTDLSILNGLITNGSSAGLWSSTSPEVETNNFYKALVVMSIPLAWSQVGVDGSGIFWMTGEGLGDDDADITTCDGATKAAADKFDTIGFYEPSVAFACDTSTDTPYWLVYLGEKCTYSKAEFLWECTDQHQSQPPPGVDKLDGTNFGGLELTDLLMSSVNAYVANGNANGWDAVDMSSWDVIVDVGDNGVQAAGMYSSPICSYTEASYNWYYQKSTDNFPCN